MNSRITHPFRSRGILIVGATVAAVTLSACAGPEQQQNEDRNTCSSMGASFGSRGYTDCMLQQQQRQDDKMHKFLEEQRMHQELGRPAREKLEEKRRLKEREEQRR